MPEKDGIEMVKEILAIDSAAVIFTMSWKDEVGDYQETARMLAARRGFEKPEGFSRHHHLGTVQIALRNLLPYSSGGVVN